MDIELLEKIRWFVGALDEYSDDRFYTHQFKEEYWTEITNTITHWMLVPELPNLT